MAKLPVDTRLKIEQEIEDRFFDSELRPYLGISTIAHKCARKLWYDFRWVSKKQNLARNHRLLNRGHREEPIIISDLISAGCIVLYAGNDQQEFITGNGHIMGHGDGEVRNLPDAPKTPHLLECKTANEKNFSKMKKNGLKKTNPVYYGQVVTYMHLGEYERALFIMVNKNTDERYYERIYPDKDHAEYLIQRGFDIICMESPPEKIGDVTFYECKWCDHYEVCQLNGDIQKTCRTCEFGDIHDNGIWKCSRYGNIILSTSQQKLGCKNPIKLKTL